MVDARSAAGPGLRCSAGRPSLLVDATAHGNAPASGAVVLHALASMPIRYRAMTMSSVDRSPAIAVQDRAQPRIAQEHVLRRTGAVRFAGRP